MTPRFNLLDEPWLPVRFADGRVRDVGLLELFERAGEIGALAETAPPSLIAEYRLLLAITHRALTWAHGPWKDKDRARWYRESLPQDALRDYLQHWRDRFWLFHPEQPFMQVAALATAAETAELRFHCSTVTIDQLYGSAMFDHGVFSKTPRQPAVVLRDLLGFFQFVPGGFFPGKKLKSSDKAGPLVNTAAVLPLGRSLRETLCLALHPSTAAAADDLPSWERAPATIAQLQAEPALASGPNDRYSRLSRSVLLLPSASGEVEAVQMAAGLALGDDPNAPDPMASYRAGKDMFVRVTFTEGKAFWRELPALVPDAEGKACQPAAVLGWAANLHPYLGALPVEQPLLIAGLASDQGKLLRWRCEQIALPVALLADPQAAGFLRSEVRRTEALYEQVRSLATGMLADTMPDPRSKDTRARARAVLDASAAAATFFAVAERALPALMQRIGAGDGDGASRDWSASLLQAAEACWETLRRHLGQSPKALRAEARAWPRFRALLRDLQPAAASPQPSKEAQA